MSTFILASNSPRRRALLKQVHYSFTVQPSTVDEKYDKNASPETIVQQLARMKAEDVWRKNKDIVVLGADTIVVQANQTLGKPSDEDEVREMLRALSGKVHHVYTGVAIFSRNKEDVFYEKTAVQFYHLSDDDISMYISSHEPFDKAGSYGIQGLGAYFVKQIKGDYNNVVGLPLARTMRVLKDVGIAPIGI